MRIEIPFITDLVGKTGGEYQHVYARASTVVEVPEIDLRDTPEAVIWRADGQPCGPDNGELSTLWHDNSHWMVMHDGVCGARPGWWLSRMDIAPPTPAELFNRGFVAVLHAREPQKVAQARHIPHLNAVRKRISDIQTDTTDALAQAARRVAVDNIASLAGRVIIRCPEPHYVIARNLRGGAPSAPRMRLGVSFGFNRGKTADIEHLVSALEPEVAEAIMERIVADGYHRDTIEQDESPAFHIAIAESIQHPWHTDSAALAIDMLVEAGRGRLDRMSTEDVRLWMSLARMRDRGIDTEDKALAAMSVADRLQLSLRTPPCLVREFRDRLHMSVYGVKPNLARARGGIAP